MLHNRRPTAAGRGVFSCFFLSHEVDRESQEVTNIFQSEICLVQLFNVSEGSLDF